ncbi:MAG: YbhB/YbcL family Raf kinase inhibitor-like protein [Myxococcota bacterium]
MTTRYRPYHLRLTASCALLLACGGAATGGAIPSTAANTGDPPLQDAPSAPASLTVTSTDFEPGGSMDRAQEFAGFGCTGDNVAPRLAWSGAPAETQAYALVVHDPDAPTGVGFFHWVVTDLPAETTSLGGGAPLPTGAREHHTDYGASGYGGPCPPPGPEHRYVFSVYALDARLELPEGATGALVRFALRSHTLAYGRLVGTYGR